MTTAKRGLRRKRVKAAFLDIDGVFNSKTFYLQRKAQKNTARCARWDQEIDRAAIKTMNALFEAGDVAAVISSTWRKTLSLEELRRLFRRAGFVGSIVGKTPDLNGAQRGEEIATWLRAHPEIEHFVVFDDDSDMDAVKEHFVHTNWEHGLLPEHVEKAKEILKKEWKRG